MRKKNDNVTLVDIVVMIDKITKEQIGLGETDGGAALRKQVEEGAGWSPKTFTLREVKNSDAINTIETNTATGAIHQAEYKYQEKDAYESKTLIGKHRMKRVLPNDSNAHTAYTGT